MSTQVEATEFRLDSLKWVVIVALVVGAAVANSYFSDVPLLYRVLGLLVAAGAALFVATQTAKGFAFWSLCKEAMVEVRKVVWPTRQETNQTTLIVVAVVIFMAIVLWLLDTLIGWLASLIIG
jgi:preprotein translocase subunit SecE